MSRQTSNHSSRLWQVLESRIRGMHVTYRGSSLNHLSLCVVTDAIFLWVLCINDLYEVIDKQLSLGEVGRWIDANSLRPINEIIEDMKLADELILQQIGDGYFDLSRFKHEYRALSHSNNTLLLNYPLMRQSITGKEEWLMLVHQSLTFLTRLTLDSDDVVMRDAAVEHFVDTDDHLPQTPDDHLARFMQRLKPWHINEDIVGYHSGGAVAGNVRNSLSDKYRNIGRDCMTDYLDLRIRPQIPFARPDLLRISELVTVPKNVSRYRTISKEPCALQYYQHGVGKSVERFIHLDKYLSRRINLHDSDINRKYAQSASWMGRWSTIDLSDASDSLSLALVKSSLWGTDLLQASLLVRSKSIKLPDGTVRTLNKYAGMGSRMTFLLECLFFCAIIEDALEEGGLDPGKSGYRVYGDDILVETEYVPELKERLSHYGFKVNTTKSYNNTTGDFIFRESCGGEFVNGVDITPIRLPRNFRGLTIRSQRIQWQSAAIELANRCYEKLPSVRAHILHCLLAMKDEKKPIFSMDGMLGVYSPDATNFHLPHRYNDNYQCDALVHGAVKVPYSRSSRDDEVAYLEWLRLSDGRSRLLYPEDRIDVTTSAIPSARWITTSTLW